MLAKPGRGENFPNPNKAGRKCFGKCPSSSLYPGTEKRCSGQNHPMPSPKSAANRAKPQDFLGLVCLPKKFLGCFRRESAASRRREPLCGCGFLDFCASYARELSNRHKKHFGDPSRDFSQSPSS